MRGHAAGAWIPVIRQYRMDSRGVALALLTALLLGQAYCGQRVLRARKRTRCRQAAGNCSTSGTSFPVQREGRILTRSPSPLRYRSQPQTQDSPDPSLPHRAQAFLSSCHEMLIPWNCHCFLPQDARSYPEKLEHDLELLAAEAGLAPACAIA